MNNQTSRSSYKFKNLIMKSVGYYLLLAMAFITLNVQAQSPEKGDELFNMYCVSCHDVGDMNKIGPGLMGINEKRSEEWLISWIKNSQDLIQQNDAEAVEVYEQYQKAMMPPFTQLSDEDIKSILLYVDVANTVVVEDNTTEDSDVTTTKTMEFSDTLIYSILFGAMVLLILLIVYYKKLASGMESRGFLPLGSRNTGPIFFIIVFICLIVLTILSKALGAGSNTLNYLMFATLPYAALVIFLGGSIMRYRRRGFQVSSLSSQFLEGRKLFFGSQLFHWGLLVLFFGHLIAFLFPQTLLAWNGQPVRLLILEFASFAFGLSALAGIIRLVIRRLRSKKLLVVSNHMDFLVYAILLVQIVTGLGTAFFVRWGSSWFASSITPYLRSIFAFNPDIETVSAMPIWIQLHIISAFFIIGVIPFTRFMHFLVAPVDYIWRKYQLVIWNWDKSKIRNSKQYFPGKKSRNH
jgi:nitrate reductase gamma subunit